MPELESCFKKTIKEKRAMHQIFTSQRYLLFLCLFLLTRVSTGQDLPEDLPNSAEKMLNRFFEKESVVLEKKRIIVPGSSPLKFFTIFSEKSNETLGYLYFGRVKTCRTGGCSLPGNSRTGEESEYFDYLILFNSAMTVENIQVVNYQASYGHEIAARGWLQQFRGYAGKKPLEVGKNIDAVSGATVSTQALAEDVAWKTKILQEINQ
jgi:hypothetical protein